MKTPNIFIKRFISLLMGLGILFSFILPVSVVSALGATSTDMPLHFIRSGDCTGEDVEISGTIHLVNQTQADGSLIGHFNYMDVTALGLTSGANYRVNAVDHLRLSAPFPSDITSVQTFRLISRGSGSNLLIHATYHITINANGEMTASLDNLTTQCS